MKKLVCMLAVCVFAVPGVAVADTVTETFTFPTLTGYNAPASEAGTPLTLFNPALGNLTGATLNLNATATWSGGGTTDLNSAADGISIGPVLETLFPSARGNTSNTATESFGVPSGDLSSLIGPGTASTSVIVDNVLGSPASIVSTFATESVTYTYTPAVPEPEMLPVLGGILAVGVFWRRRKAG